MAPQLGELHSGNSKRQQIQRGPLREQHGNTAVNERRSIRFLQRANDPSKDQRTKEQFQQRVQFDIPTLRVYHGTLSEAYFGGSYAANAVEVLELDSFGLYF